MARKGFFSSSLSHFHFPKMKHFISFLFYWFFALSSSSSLYGIAAYQSTTQTLTKGGGSLAVPWASYLTFKQFSVPDATLVSVYISFSGGATSQISSTNTLDTEVKGYSYNQFSLSLIAGCCSGKFATTATTNINSNDFDLFAYKSSSPSSSSYGTLYASQTFRNLSPSDASYFIGNNTISFIVTSHSMLLTNLDSVIARDMIPPTSYLGSATLKYYYY